MPSCHELLPLPKIHQCLPVVNTISRHLGSYGLGWKERTVDDDFNNRFQAPRPQEQVLVVPLVVAVLVQLAALGPQFLAMEEGYTSFIYLLRMPHPEPPQVRTKETGGT